MSKLLLKQLKKLGIGTLVCLEWYDASVGKVARNPGTQIDITVRTWGVFLGFLGNKNKHIIIAQNIYKYTTGVYDVDYSAVPASGATDVTVIMRGCIDGAEAKQAFNSFTTREVASRTVRHVHLHRGE